MKLHGKHKLPLSQLECTDSRSDDTSVAVIEKPTYHRERDKRRGFNYLPGILHFHKTITADNTQHGGIHPLTAIKSHQENTARLVNEAIQALPNIGTVRSAGGIGRVAITRAGVQKAKPDFISVTRGPGMRTNISCGLDVAKGLSIAWQIPLLAIHHMQAHALTPRMVWALTTNSEVILDHVEPEPRFPFLTLLVSGGHTMLLNSTSITDHTVLADTQDVAIGDALDKIGRLLLPKELRENTNDTAFAKHLSNYAFPNEEAFASYCPPKNRAEETQKSRNKFGWLISSPLAESPTSSMSFTGIVSQVEKIFNERQNITFGLSDEERLLFARTAIGITIEHLCTKVVNALKDHKQKDLVVSGGVAANNFLRHFLRQMLNERGHEDVNLIFPPAEYCTDNAAMIGWAGIEMYKAGWRSSLTCIPLRKWDIEGNESDGSGILGVGGWMKSRERDALMHFIEQGWSKEKIREKVEKLNKRRLRRPGRDLILDVDEVLKKHPLEERKPRQQSASETMGEA